MERLRNGVPHDAADSQQARVHAVRHQVHVLAGAGEILGEVKIRYVHSTRADKVARNYGVARHAGDCSCQYSRHACVRTVANITAFKNQNSIPVCDRNTGYEKVSAHEPIE